MLEYVLSKITEMTRVARDTYGVDPVVFVTIYLLCAPVFYYSLFRTLRALAKKLANEIMLWSAILLCAIVAPFLYVLIFGHNMPWWVYGIITLLVGQGILSLVMKLRSPQRADSDTP
jgi:hypothetical protein